MSTVQILRSSCENFTNVARGSQPKDIYEAQQWEMAGAHACLVNGLLNLYEVFLAFALLMLIMLTTSRQKAEAVPAGEVQNFVQYALQWYAAINHHHESVSSLPKNIECLPDDSDSFLDGKKIYTTHCIIRNSTRTPLLQNTRHSTLALRISRNI